MLGSYLKCFSQDFTTDSKVLMCVFIHVSSNVLATVKYYPFLTKLVTVTSGLQRVWTDQIRLIMIYLAIPPPPPPPTHTIGFPYRSI